MPNVNALDVTYADQITDKTNSKFIK